MKRTQESARTPLKAVVIIVAILVVVNFVIAGYRISDSSHGIAYDYDARDYLYSAENNRFGDLYSTAVRDMNKNAVHETSVVEYQTLAFYYEQAVLEHAYRLEGDDAKADEFAHRMAEYESQLGSLSYKAAAVRAAVS